MEPEALIQAIKNIILFFYAISIGLLIKCKQSYNSCKQSNRWIEAFDEYKIIVCKTQKTLVYSYNFPIYQVLYFLRIYVQIVI